ncbi:60S ribosomal protein L13 [Sigmodon hispidus]
MVLGGNGMILRPLFHRNWQQHGHLVQLPGMQDLQTQGPAGLSALYCPTSWCPTVKYHTKVRAGRGFCLEELGVADIHKKVARTIDISVTPRRPNKSPESLQSTVQRLKKYCSKLILFPRKPSASKKADSSAKEFKLANRTPAMTIQNVYEKETAKVIPEERNFKALPVFKWPGPTRRLFGIWAEGKGSCRVRC